MTVNYINILLCISLTIITYIELVIIFISCIFQISTKMENFDRFQPQLTTQIEYMQLITKSVEKSKAELSKIKNQWKCKNRQKYICIYSQQLNVYFLILFVIDWSYNRCQNKMQWTEDNLGKFTVERNWAYENNKWTTPTSRNNKN